MEQELANLREQVRYLRSRLAQAEEENEVYKETIMKYENCYTCRNARLKFRKDSSGEMYAAYECEFGGADEYTPNWCEEWDGKNG